jgi:hypothetical protein
MIIVPIKESEFISTFASLKHKNSSGFDGISNRILIVCGKFLDKPLAYI